MMCTISSLCPNQLTEGNYLVWKNQFEEALRIHKLLPYISSTLWTPAPKLQNEEDNLEFEKHLKNDGIIFFLDQSYNIHWDPTTDNFLYHCIWSLAYLWSGYFYHQQKSYPTLQDEMISIKKVSTISMKEYLLKFKPMRKFFGNCCHGYPMNDDRVIEWGLET